MTNVLIRGPSDAAVERNDAEAAALGLDRAARLEEWNARIERGPVRLATVTRLELGFSARLGHVGREAFGLPSLSLMPIEHPAPAMEDRAFEVQMLLADRGLHRAP